MDVRTMENILNFKEGEGQVFIECHVVKIAITRIAEKIAIKIGSCTRSVAIDANGFTLYRL